MPRYTAKGKILGEDVDKIESSICEKCIFSDCRSHSDYCRLNIYWRSMERLDKAYKAYDRERKGQKQDNEKK